jgi:hypothetical protein
VYTLVKYFLAEEKVESPVIQVPVDAANADKIFRLLVIMVSNLRLLRCDELWDENYRSYSLTAL